MKKSIFPDMPAPAFVIIFCIYGFVFATGASGLIFQVTCQKYLTRILGSDSMATAIILSNFLGGLSLGYYLCGKLSTRIRNHFKGYAALEGTIGAWCILFPLIFQQIESFTRSWRFEPPFLMIAQGFICSTLLMGIPTICMGATIPFLTRGISRNITEATRIHANVYAINTGGAFVGTLIAGFYLIPMYGLPQTIMGASLLNLSAAVFFYGYSIVSGKPSAHESPEIKPLEIPENKSFQFHSKTLYLIAFFSGFYVMTLENVLIRVTNLSLGSSSYSFSLIIAVFILAIAVGSYIAGHLKSYPKYLLFFNQLGITLCLLLIYISLDKLPYWAHLIRISFQSNIAGFYGYYTAVFLGLALVLIFPVALMGATLPIAFHELKRDLHHAGEHSGFLFSWNTIGSLLGSLFGGIIFFYFMNIPHVFLISVFLAACSAMLAGWTASKKNRMIGGLACIISFFLLISVPFYNQTHFVMGTFRERNQTYATFQGADRFFEDLTRGVELLFYKDDPVGTVSVVKSIKNDDKQMSILVNGKSDSNTVIDVYTLKLLSHIPALLARNKNDVMVIGLGTGVTAGELTLYPDIEQIDVAEISPSVINALPYFSKFTYSAENDPRIRIHTGDAFRIMGRSNKKWDIIISEPSNPWTMGVDLLFTQEFYELAQRRLTEHGILVQWMHLYETDAEVLGMVLNTIQQQFRFVHVFRGSPGDLLIAATDTPFEKSDLDRAEHLLETNPNVRSSLESVYLESLDAILVREIWTHSYISDKFSDYGLQTMDNPRLHYMAGKAFFIGASIPDSFLSDPASAAYLNEYLMVKKYPNWSNFIFSENHYHALIRSCRDKVSGGFFPMIESLKLKAYLSHPERFPLTEKEKGVLKTDYIPFLDRYNKEETAWKTIHPEGASFREKASVLLDHIRLFRNWIVPYPIDGLKSLLEDGILNGKDIYEKNWCALNLAILLLQEKADMNSIQAILSRIIRDGNGFVIQMEADKDLVSMLNELIQKAN